MIQLLWTQMVRREINGWTKISHVSIGLQAIKWPHHSTLSKEIVCWIMPYQKLKIYLWRYLIHHSFIYNNVKYMLIQFSSVQSLSRVRLFATPWIAARQASLSTTNSWSSPKLMSIESVMPSSHLIFCHDPVSSCPQSLPAAGSFPMSQLFAWGGQSIGVSALASVLPTNTQDWSPLGWTGWISLQSKGLSRVFSNTTVQKHQFFSVQRFL